MFSNTNTWYKHVRDKHQEEYCRKCPDIPAPTLPTPEDQLGAEMDSRNSDQDEDITPLTLDTPLVNDAPTFVTQDVADGLLLKLKGRHRLSQAAIDEVVQIIGTVSEHIVIESLTALRQCGEALHSSRIYLESLRLRATLWPHLGQRIDSSRTSKRTSLTWSEQNLSN